MKPLSHCVKIKPIELETPMGAALHIYTGRGIVVAGQDDLGEYEVIFPMRDNFAHEEDGQKYFYCHKESIVAEKDNKYFLPCRDYIKVLMPTEVNGFTGKEETKGRIVAAGVGVDIKIGLEVIIKNPTVFRVEEDGEEYSYIHQSDLVCTS